MLSIMIICKYTKCPSGEFKVETDHDLNDMHNKCVKWIITKKK